MLDAIILIFCCQLAGELGVVALGLPLPGPVAGMCLLFAGLLWKGSVPAEIAGVADAILSNLSLLFVPAGVGVMLHAALIGRDWLPITAAVLASTFAAIVVTALLMRWLAPTGAAPAADATGDPKP